MKAMRWMLLSFGVAAVSCSWGCGGEGSSASPTPVPTPTPLPARASLSLEQNGQAQLCLSPVAGQTFRLAIPIRVSESAGLGANANYARLSLWRNGVEIERSEVTANGITTACGTNHIQPHGLLTGTVNFDFNSSEFDSSSFVFNLTDDRGGNHDLTIDELEGEMVLFCTTVRNTSADPGVIRLEIR